MKPKNKFFIILILFASLFAAADKVSATCVYDGENFHIGGDPSQILSPIHRLYNTKNGAYLYTRSVADANYVLGKWPDFEYTDGVPAFCAHDINQDGLTPIYRLYNKRNGAYLYTRGENDRDYVLNKYHDFEFTDGIPSFYASLTPQDGLTPIYRLYNTKNGMYLYVRGDADKTHVMNTWPEFEFTDGVPAFYADITSDSGPTLYRYEGPEISVGLWGYSKSDIQDQAFQINANKPYNIRDNSGNIIAQMAADAVTNVTYDADGNLKVYNSIPETLINTVVTFDATDNNNSDIIFNTYRPGSSYDHYRGKIKAQYYHGADIVGGNTGTTVQQVWIVNTLPLEQYIWGEGETTGTGPMDHTKVMTTMFRTYGFWYIKYANKYAAYGFKIRSDSGSQIYWGYDRETQYPNVKTAAQATRGIFATYSGDVALTPYSSWSDGRTRSYQERWGSTAYPWCKSVSDPYGKHATLSTAELEAAGNHMVGLIANGSLNLAGSSHNKTWDWILKYYYTGISLPTNY